MDGLLFSNSHVLSDASEGKERRSQALWHTCHLGIRDAWRRAHYSLAGPIKGRQTDQSIFGSLKCHFSVVTKSKCDFLYHLKRANLKKSVGMLLARAVGGESLD